MMRDDDTRPLRPASRLVRLTAPDFAMAVPAKSLWINDKGVVSVKMIAEKDDEPVTVNIFGPSLLPVRVKAIIPDGTSAKDIVAMCD